jgi:hypothetical protein
VRRHWLALRRAEEEQEEGRNGAGGGARHGSWVDGLGRLLAAVVLLGEAWWCLLEEGRRAEAAVACGSGWCVCGQRGKSVSGLPLGIENRPCPTCIAIVGPKGLVPGASISKAPQPRARVRVQSEATDCRCRRRPSIVVGPARRQSTNRSIKPTEPLGTRAGRPAATVAPSKAAQAKYFAAASSPSPCCCCTSKEAPSRSHTQQNRTKARVRDGLRTFMRPPCQLACATPGIPGLNQRPCWILAAGSGKLGRGTTTTPHTWPAEHEKAGRL